MLQHLGELPLDGNPGLVRKFLAFHLLASKTVLIGQLNQAVSIPELVKKYRNEMKCTKKSHNMGNNIFSHCILILC